MTVDTTFFLVATIVVVALIFDFTNGFHDAANAIATSVATRALSPRAGIRDSRTDSLSLMRARRPIVSLVSLAQDCRISTWVATPAGRDCGR